MARKPTQIETLTVAITDADTPGLPAMVEASNQLALQHQERQDAARRLACEIGYELPGGAPDPELIVRDIATHMRRSVEECLEIGRGLLVLKEACEHGEFGKALESLHFDWRMANRFMQATLKFGNWSTSTNLEKIGSSSKLIELLVLDDEQIAELEQGQIGELALDDVAKMSVTELRRALRETRSDSHAKDEVIGDTKAQLIKLQIQTRKKIVAADVDWLDAITPLCDQVAVAGRKIAQGINELEICRIKLFEVGGELSDEERKKYETALGHAAEIYNHALDKAERDITRERDTYEKSLACFADDPK